MATGVAVKVGENFGIKIKFIGEVKLRIAALGAAKAEESRTLAAANGQVPSAVAPEPVAAV